MSQPEDKVPFQCKAEWRHGPGHQSRTLCTRSDEHDIMDDHYVEEVIQEWSGADTHYGERW